jgi:hypothetical protein
MQSILEVKEALQARSTSTSLDELRQQGRSRVRVIRAEHIAEMIAEAVQRAVSASGLVGPEEVERLVADSRREAERAQQMRERVEELEHELDVAQSRVAELEREVASADGGPSSADGATVARLMQEVAALKATMHPQPVVQAAPAPNTDALAAALDKIAGSLNDRLDSFGRKMGISSAVDASEVNFDGLFKHNDEAKIESNMDTVQLKQKSGGGIAANLEKLRKLKGGG